MNIIEALHAILDESMLAHQDAPRDYLGASVLGNECQRATWYAYHQPENNFKAETLRKFDFGHLVEPLAISWLIKAGLTLFTSIDGKQFRFDDGHLGGSCDGVVKGIPGDELTPYLLEVKSANDFSFKAFKKDGITHNKGYSGQVQIYMHQFNLKKCLFMVVNKNSQEIYFEIVEYDEFEATRLIQRGHQTVEMQEAPERHYQNKSFFLCKMCSYYGKCWSNE